MRAAAPDPAVVSVGAERGRRAVDPRCPGKDQLGSDAPDAAVRAASLDDLEGALKRHGCSARRRGVRQTHRRYEWADAGALLHIDALRLPKFDRPGHWATGQRAEEHKTRQAGKTVVIGVLDDHTRLAYCELHGEETALTVTATLRRAAVWMREQGCGPAQAVMSDNHKAYSSGAFTELLTQLGARQILTPAYTPRWNGKIERFFGTARREWSHSRVWPNSTTRDRALASFLRFYNRRRPHSAAGGRPPISRVHQVRGQDRTIRRRSRGRTVRGCRAARSRRWQIARPTASPLPRAPLRPARRPRCSSALRGLSRPGFREAPWPG